MAAIDWQDVRQQHPIVDTIGRYVQLRKKGKEYEACCPFHAEKTPSFTVNEAKQFYHCFGCGAHGDVIDFVERYHGVERVEALNMLTGGNFGQLDPAQKKQREAEMQQRQAEDEQRQQAAIESARQRWERAIPMDGGTNTYLERKGVAPHMCKREGDNLLIPMYGSDGELQSVQSIAPDGGKLFHKNAPTKNARLMIGVNFGRIIVAEGYATGASIFDAMADQVAVAFSKGNMHHVARDLCAQGFKIILAADSNAADEMRALGDELDVPVAIPECGSDFNDQAHDRGIASVADTFRQALLDFANKPEAPPEPPSCSLQFIDAFDFDEHTIPVRPWLVPGVLLSGCTHLLAAPGGTGKSLYTLQMALMMATGNTWGKWQPRKKCRVLIINAEDDTDEQHRRLAAARNLMCINTHDVRGQVMMAHNPSSILMSKMDDAKGKTQNVVATPLVKELREVIQHYQIDVVIVDPFAETFEGDENSNNDTKWAMKIWRDDIARSTGAAVLLVHHTTKNAGDKAGSADAIRGAGALVNSARMAATLFVMTKDEAEAMNIKEEDRFRYVRYDDAKSNQSLIGSRQWFEKVSIKIGNGDPEDSESGDEVGALRPWEPNGINGFEYTQVISMMDAINAGYINEDGIYTDQPFGRTGSGKSARWVGNVVMEHLGVDDEQAKALLRMMFDRGILEEYDCHDGYKGRSTKGVRANLEKAKTAFG